MSFFDKTPVMQLCRDVANGLKHYRLSLDRRPVPMNPGWSTTESRMTMIPPEPTRWFARMLEESATGICQEPSGPS